MLTTTLQRPDAPAPATQASDLARLAEAAKELGDSKQVRLYNEAEGPAEYCVRYTIVYTRNGFVHVHNGRRRIASTLTVDEAIERITQLAAARRN